VSEEAAQRPPQAHARSGERQCGARLVGGPYLAVTNLPRRFLHVWSLLPGGGGGGGGRQRRGGGRGGGRRGGGGGGGGCIPANVAAPATGSRMVWRAAARGKLRNHLTRSS